MVAATDVQKGCCSLLEQHCKFDYSSYSFFFCAICGYVGRLQLGPDRKILAFVDIDLVFCVPSNRAT